MHVHAQALQILKDRRFSEAECEATAAQLMRYKDGLTPYNASCLPGGSVREWWETKRLPSGVNEPLISLALVLLDIVPHAAATERVFSTMGWLHSDVRNRLSVERTAMMTAVKLDLANRCDWEPLGGWVVMPSTSAGLP